MKQFFKMFFASLLAMVIAGVIVVIVAVSVIVGVVSKATTSSSSNTAATSGDVLRIDLKKQLNEQGENNSLAAFGDGSSFTAGLYDAIRAVEAAKTDNNIKGIYIELDNPPNSWATLQQLRAALLSFRSSGKFIYAYGESISQRAYYIATAADSIFLNPVGHIEINGLSTNLTFFKGTLQKLDIQPEIFYAGKFKSATEPFRSDRMSDENRAQIAAIQQDLWTEFLAGVSGRTGLDTATIQQLVASGSVQFPTDALRYKLIHSLSFRDEVEDLIRRRTGQKEDEKIKYAKLDEYAQTQQKKTGDTRIAVLFAQGGITDGTKSEDYQIASEDFVKEIRKIRRNNKVKAVVMRVNSPGGSALASEVILRELKLLQKKKPLVVSMGDVAASGGYYIACGADSIFAMPTTITGSIGVFGMLFNIEGLMKNKLGITFDQVKNAPYADFPAAHRQLTVNEKIRMQQYIDTIYALFKSRVVDGRKLPAVLIDSIAQGRIWSGTDAFEFGLVDGLGNLDRALASAAAKAGIKDYTITTYPERIDKLESLMRRLSESPMSAETYMRQALGDDYSWYQEIKALRDMNGKMMMALPFRIEVK